MTTPAADSSTAPLRFLIRTRTSENWDDRAKEWYTSHSETRPVLQYWDGHEWQDVPTVREPER